MFKLVITSLPMFVCAFWSMVLLLDWRKYGNRGARCELLLWAVTACLLYSCHWLFFNGDDTLLPVSDPIYVACNLAVYPFFLYYLRVLTGGRPSAQYRLLIVPPPFCLALLSAFSMP